MSPLTPFSGGCKPSVYRGFRTLTPLKWKISRTRVRRWRTERYTVDWFSGMQTFKGMQQAYWGDRGQSCPFPWFLYEYRIRGIYFWFQTSGTLHFKTLTVR